MSRTKHLTRAEADNNSRLTRARAKTRLTKLGDRLYFGNDDRPKNEGNAWKFGYNSGKRHRKRVRADKVIGRRLERRRLDQSLLP